MADSERIEVLRGGASVAYADAVLGAVVNIVRRAPASRHLMSELQLGDGRDRALRVSVQQAVGSGRLGLGAAAARIDGSRSHAEATNAAASVGYATRPDDRASRYVRVGLQRLTTSRGIETHP